MLHELNPRDVDFGVWYEARRKALLDASFRNRYFWHSFWVSLAGILLTTALVKTWYDQRRERRIMGEQMDLVRAHDAYSRQMAQEAIRQYNEHIELCNRAIEATDAGLSTALGGNSPIATLRAELDAEKQKVSGLERDKQRLDAEVAQKTALITDLSLRIDALTKQIGNGHGSDSASVSTSSHPELVRHINSLQQQLYAEREKNKRLKGGG
jgi:chromosome segregation ATPase